MPPVVPVPPEPPEANREDGTPGFGGLSLPKTAGGLCGRRVYGLVAEGRRGFVGHVQVTYPDSARGDGPVAGITILAIGDRGPRSTPPAGVVTGGRSQTLSALFCLPRALVVSFAFRGGVVGPAVAPLQPGPATPEPGSAGVERAERETLWAVGAVGASVRWRPAVAPGVVGAVSFHVAFTSQLSAPAFLGVHVGGCTVICRLTSEVFHGLLVGL